MSHNPVSKVCYDLDGILAPWKEEGAIFTSAYLIENLACRPVGRIVGPTERGSAENYVDEGAACLLEHAPRRCSTCMFGSMD